MVGAVVPQSQVGQHLARGMLVPGGAKAHHRPSGDALQQSLGQSQPLPGPFGVHGLVVIGVVQGVERHLMERVGQFPDQLRPGPGEGGGGEPGHRYLQAVQQSYQGLGAPGGYLDGLVNQAGGGQAVQLLQVDGQEQGQWRSL